jgi:hypothetical protein
VALALQLVPSAAAGRPTGSPRFVVAPQPRLVVRPGAKLALRLVASARGGTIRIGTLGLPPGAELVTRPGRPAEAVFRWTAPASGSYSVTFTAVNLRSPRIGVTRGLIVTVRPRPVNLEGIRETWYWAFVDRPVAARSRPSFHARVVADMGTETPEGTTNLVLLTLRMTDSAGRQWYRARLPILPNNATGWMPASALGPPVRVRTHLVVDRKRLTATLYRRGKPIFSARIGIGTDAAPTPTGEFYVRDLLLHFNNPFYGPAAFGTSARSSVLTDWPDGGHIGIHGTNEPGLIPGRISHGCIRMRNAAIEQLVRLMPVGTPVSIR